MDSCSLIKRLKLDNRKQKASSINGAGLTGTLYVEKGKQIHIYYHAQSSSRIRNLT